MKAKLLAGVLGCLLAGLSQLSLGQDTRAAVLAHVETARRAAGADHAFVFRQLCAGPIEYSGAAPVTGEVPRALPSTDPERDWYAEPVRVFDDLFFLGQTAFSAWGLRTSEGIILVDAIFEYSVEAEVIGGLRKLGIDPEEIRYVIISHAHGDHSGGAGVLQQLGARVVMSEADWDLYEATARETVKARRDIVATDGMAIALGDHTVRTFLTPGHTHGTISTLLPVHDKGAPHLAAVWGGTLFNFRDSPEDPRDQRLGDYARSAVKFQGIAAGAGVDVILSNHTAYDGSTVKLPALNERRAGMPHPYVIGNDAVLRYLKVAEECALAARIAEASPVPAVGTAFTDCAGCPEMVVLPAGDFLMGSPPDEPERRENEPQHRVTIARPFAMSRTPVTWNQWEACVRDNWCEAEVIDAALRLNPDGTPIEDYRDYGRGTRPAVGMNWYDALRFVGWLNWKTGADRYALPSEAQWEYGARAGSTTAFPWGAALDYDYGNFGQRESGLGGHAEGRDTWVNETSPVASFPPNAFGLYDMHGNIFEWTQDCYEADFAHAPADGSANTEGDCSVRVFRSGTFVSNPYMQRSARRGAPYPATARGRNYLGFRVVKSLD